MGSQRTLTRDLLHELFELRDGVLYRDGKVAGDLSKGRWRIGIKNHKYFRSKIVWCMVHGNWPKEIDHINRDKSDDRIENLREATRQHNLGNVGDKPRTTSLPRGVHPHRGRFRAQIRNQYKIITTRTCSTPEEAHELYKAKHLEIHGEFSPYSREER